MNSRGYEYIKYKQEDCEHKETTTVSLDVAYYIACLDCGKQFSESEWVDRQLDDTGVDGGGL